MSYWIPNMTPVEKAIFAQQEDIPRHRQNHRDREDEAIGKRVIRQGEIENPEKQEAIADGEDPESICILYGTDYGEIQSLVEETLINWKLAEPWR